MASSLFLNIGNAFLLSDSRMIRALVLRISDCRSRGRCWKVFFIQRTEARRLKFPTLLEQRQGSILNTPSLTSCGSIYRTTLRNIVRQEMALALDWSQGKASPGHFQLVTTKMVPRFW